jgi:CheY-like chemotaxis protein
MDFVMPNMNGPDATRKIRELGYDGIIIGVTGNTLPCDIDHFKLSGANDVLAKPLNMEKLEHMMLSNIIYICIYIYYIFYNSLNSYNNIYIFIYIYIYIDYNWKMLSNLTRNKILTRRSL